MNVDLSQVSDPRDRAVLQSVADHLDSLLGAAANTLLWDVATLVQEDRHAILAEAARTTTAEPAVELFLAALLEMAQRIGPEGSRLNFYLRRGEGPIPLKMKKRIERYRTMLREKR